MAVEREMSPGRVHAVEFVSQLYDVLYDQEVAAMLKVGPSLLVSSFGFRA